MKLLLGFSLALFSFGALANNSISSTLERVEREKNVVCEHVKTSMGFCLGGSSILNTCYSKMTFKCHGQDNFTLQLKIKTFYNGQTNQRESVVTKTIIKK